MRVGYLGHRETKHFDDITGFIPPALTSLTSVRPLSYDTPRQF